MVNVAVTSNMLFIKKKLSFEKKLKVVLSFILGEFFKYNISADPVIIAKNNKIEEEVVMNLNEQLDVGGYSFEFVDINENIGPN